MKKGVSEGSATPEPVNKFKRTIADGLILVVPTKVYGKEVKTLIDNGQQGALLLHPASLG